MSIQVMDFELERPTSRVVKPEKGTAMSSMYGGGGMGMMMGGNMMRRFGMSGYGGMASNFRASTSNMRFGPANPFGMMGAGGGMGA